jgi:dTDP-4-dehydrorhamnose 3,5-epimerase
MDSSLATVIGLAVHTDERGRLTEIFRLTDDAHGFGQCYVTTCAAGIIKAWHRHREQWDRWFCVGGAAKLGLFDSATGESQTVILSADLPQLVLIRPGLWHGFTPAWGHREAAVLNIVSRPYAPADPDEQRLGPYALPFHWDVQSR